MIWLTADADILFALKQKPRLRWRFFEEIESILDKRYQSNDMLSTSGRDEEYYAGRADLCLSLLGMIDEIKKKYLEKK